MTLTEFLLARIAEDEAVARKAMRFYQHVLGIPHYFMPPNGKEFPDPRISMTPVAALAECASKRAIVGIAKSSESGDCGWYLTFNLALKALALPYADHPDFDESWRP